jgi:predicted alpha/beta superfamily hydrolase
MTAGTPGSGRRAGTPFPLGRGELRSHRDFASEILKNRRTIVVHLPPKYATDVRKRYPVFYLHDGQNVFEAATSCFGVEWQADESADRLIGEGRIEPLILVGIYNTPDRINEYTTHYDPRQRLGGKGRAYGDFVMEELKPFIDRHYRTLPGREHTAVGGSSLGGLITLGMAREQHEHFSKCAILSPSLWWDGGRLLRELGRTKKWLRDMRFWIDMGTGEGDTRRNPPSGIVQLRRLRRIFTSARLRPDLDYHYWEVEGGEHNEANWAARFDKVLLYFFGTESED